MSPALPHIPKARARRVPLLALAFAAALPLPGAAAEPRPEQRPAAAPGSTGLIEIAGGLAAAGPDWKAFFHAGGIEFHAALGASAPRNLPLAFQLESVDRGGARSAVAGGAIPWVESPAGGAERVVYRHGASLTECYDVLAEGIEQSFVLSELPAGGGDLVVRGRLATELACDRPGERAAELGFSAFGGGGVRIGGVLGIDAAGRRAAGWLRAADGVLELGLPAEFVESAALPLVLDPLISTAGLVAATLDHRRPDIAFDATSERYLVAWDLAFSAQDVDVRGRLLTAGGTITGPLLVLEVATTTYAFRPVVANVNLTDRFLVVWQQGGAEQVPPSTPTVFGASVNPATAQNTGSTLMWFDATAPDLAGDSTLVDDDAFLVFVHGTLGVRAASVAVPASGLPTVQTSYPLPSSNLDTEPAISKHGGSSRRYAIAWTHEYQPVPLDRDVQAVLFSPLTGALGSVVSVTLSSKDESRSTVDGNGVNFAIAWQRQASASERDIVVRRFTWHDTKVSSSSESTLAQSPVDQVEPEVAFAGPKYIIAWAQRKTGDDYDLYMSSLVPATLAQAEPVTPISTETGTSEREPAMCSRLDAGSSSDEAMVAWHSLGFGSFTPSIDIQLVEAVGDGGPVVDLGGGCGAGGVASWIGPFAVGNPTFVLTLANAAPAAPSALLNISLPGPTLNCGSCVWNPYFITALVPLGAGTVLLPLAVPPDMGLAGLTVDVQWNVQQSGVTPCFLGPGLSLSNRLRLTLGF